MEPIRWKRSLFSLCVGCVAFFRRSLQDFPAQKAFISWRSAGRRGRMVKAGQVLEERIFALHPWFSFLEK